MNAIDDSGRIANDACLRCLYYDSYLSAFTDRPTKLYGRLDGNRSDPGSNLFVAYCR